MQVVLPGVAVGNAPTKKNMSLFEMGGIFTQFGRIIEVGLAVGLPLDLALWPMRRVTSQVSSAHCTRGCLYALCLYGCSVYRCRLERDDAHRLAAANQRW